MENCDGDTKTDSITNPNFSCLLAENSSQTYAITPLMGSSNIPTTDEDGCRLKFLPTCPLEFAILFLSKNSDDAIGPAASTNFCALIVTWCFSFVLGSVAIPCILVIVLLFFVMEFALQFAKILSFV